MDRILGESVWSQHPRSHRTNGVPETVGFPSNGAGKQYCQWAQEGTLSSGHHKLPAVPNQVTTLCLGTLQCTVTQGPSSIPWDEQSLYMQYPMTLQRAVTWKSQTPTGRIAVGTHCRRLWSLAHRKVKIACPRGLSEEGRPWYFCSGAGDQGVDILFWPSKEARKAFQEQKPHRGPAYIEPSPLSRGSEKLSKERLVRNSTAGPSPRRPTRRTGAQVYGS